MQAFPVLKALFDEQKLISVGFLSITKRQFQIIAGTLAACYAIQFVLSVFISWTMWSLVAAFGPFVVAAALVSFVKAKDGKHLDWHVLRYVINLLRPQVYLWRAERTAEARGTKGTDAPGVPGAKAGRQGLPLDKWFPISDAVQKVLPTERIVKNMVRLDDGTYAVILEVEPVNLSLGTEAQREFVFHATVDLYNRLQFPICELTATEPMDVSRYVTTLRHHARARAAAGDDRLSLFGEQLASYVDRAKTENQAYEARSHVVLTYKPPLPKGVKAKLGFVPRDKKKPTEKDTQALQRETNQAYTILAERVNIVADALYNMGAEARVLQHLELLGFMWARTAGGAPERTRGGARIWEPITLDEGTYATLTPEKLASHIRAAEQVRKKGAPPALGSGDVTLPTLSDKIAPSALKVTEDYVRVNKRLCATLFVSEYPDAVTFGVMRKLLSIPGRITITKYLRPVDKGDAIRQLRNRMAELSAAGRTNTSGNIGDAFDREQAAASVALALERLQNDQERYVRMCFYVACEADNREELDKLVSKVESKLDEMRITARVAHEEALEGWLTTRPFGRDCLSRRYTEKGFLTPTLACFNTYATWRLNHEDGVFLGLDLSSGTFAYLDNRRLSNPHMIVLGVPGGGKSFGMKVYATRQRLRDHRVVIIDPVGDSKYGKVAEALGGEQVILGPDSKHKINPCDLNEDYLNVNLLSQAASEDPDSLDEEEQRQARRDARAGAFNGKILMLTRLTELMASAEDSGRGLTGRERTRVEKLWVEVYEYKGITQDPETHHKTPPTFRDFFDKITGREDMDEIHDKLYSWDQGILKNTFDSQTNVNLHNKFLVLQIAALKDRVKPPLMFAVLDFLTGKLSNPEEPAECLIDEVWSLLKDKDAGELLNELWRTGRARNCAMVGISQMVAEFANSEAGQVIFGLSKTHLILLQDDNTAKALKGVGRFSDHQVSELTKLRQGQGYLIVQDKQIPLKILASKYEERLFNTDPEKERRYLAAERADRRSQEEAQQKEVEENQRKALPAAPAAAPAGRPPERPPRREPRRDAEQQPTPLPQPRATRPGVGNPRGDAPTAPTPPVRGASATPARRPAPERSQPAPTVSVARRRGARAKIFAVAGPTSGIVGLNLAGLLAASGKPNKARVLFADAEGGITRDFLSEFGTARPDSLTDILKHDIPESELKELVKPYVTRDPESGLYVMPMVAEKSLPANVIASQLARLVDVVVVACGASQYARDWLMMADEVVATAPHARTLQEIVSSAEQVRGENGTLLAPMGTVRVEKETLFSHAMFRLPPPDLPVFSEASENETFATLTDEEVRRAFEPLARKLVAAGHDHAPNADQDETHPGRGGGNG